ncbi:MAG: c-type cytochrome [Pseudomonadota bacterium]
MRLILSQGLSFARTAAKPIVAATAMLCGLAYALPPGTADEIRARLEPFGKVCVTGEDCGRAGAAVAAATPVAAGASGGAGGGEGVYNQYCFACHMAGVAGAPKFGDPAAWASRVEKGIEALYASTINGINAMPAKGTCMSCSDDDLKATVDYMVEAAQ